jgi:EAL domain-containing protein (putative c-di-GMP-specific phosphodiesterase class I)
MICTWCRPVCAAGRCANGMGFAWSFTLAGRTARPPAAAGRTRTSRPPPECPDEPEQGSTDIAANSSSATVEIQELAVHYQPQFALRDGRLVGFEGLLRWQDPSGELVLPADFLNELQHGGMLRAATLDVIDRMTGQIEDWREWLPNEAGIAVNIPAAILADQSLQKDLRRLGRERPDIARHLVIEVSERSTSIELSNACAEHRRLCGDRIRLALDDVGTGPRSGDLIRSLPVDIAKLDNSIVAGLPDNRRCAAVARAVIALSHDHGMQVAAVGIEHDNQRDFLAELGCDIGQGFHFAPVEPPTRASRWLPDR